MLTTNELVLTFVVPGPIFVGEMGPHLTQCRLDRGLPQYQVVPDPSSRLATIDMGRKRWSGYCAPFRV